MDLQSPKSPLWRKPSDIMKLRQMNSRKRILQKRLGLAREDKQFDDRALLCSSVPNQNHGVGVNPFRCSPRKRPKSDSDIPSDLVDVSCDTTLFQLLQVSEQAKAVNGSQEQNDSQAKTDVLHYQEPSSETPKKDSSCTQWFDYLPVDWSLKIALRLTSSQPFPWSSRLTTLEEASGVTGFVRCLPLSGNVQPCAIDTSSSAQLYQCCQIWIHPSLPWLNLFPRFQNKRPASKSIPLDSHIHQELHTDWAESFRSLFHLLRTRQCPYFYVCSHKFTVIFRAAGICGNPRVHAMLTPTSRGFRTSLNEEGVEFTMPLSNETKKEDSDVEASSAEAGASDEIDDDEMFSWLKSVGVGGDMLAHLDKEKHRLNQKQKSGDYRPESLIYMEDGNVHALFNYLLNSKSCIPNVGPHTGIPPTLLSPVAFTGATLRPLKLRHRQAQKDSCILHVLDIYGPILPHMAHNLKQLLAKRAPEGLFQMMFSTLDFTTPFSQCSCSATEETPSVFGQESLSDCGLLREVVDEMCSSQQGTVIHEVNIKGTQYVWS